MREKCARDSSKSVYGEASNVSDDIDVLWLLTMFAVLCMNEAKNLIIIIQT